MKQLALALLLCLAACRQPATVAPTVVPFTEGLPPVPSTFRTPIGHVIVAWVDTVETGDVNRFAVGAYDYWRRMILIRKEAQRNRVTAWAVALHELCHANLTDAGINLGQMEELVCDAIAKARIAEMLALVKR